MFPRQFNFSRKNPKITPQLSLFKFFREGSNTEMAIDGTTPKNYDLIVPSNRYYYVTRVNFTIVDGTINPGTFAGLGSVLGNGVKIQAIDKDGSTIIKDFLDGTTIKKNADFHCLAGVQVVRITGAASDDGLFIEWDLSRFTEKLFLKPDQRLRIIIQDDLSAVTTMMTMAQGIEVDLS